MLEAYFHDLVSGRRRGPLAVLIRGLLRCLEGPYSLAVTLRNHYYDRRQKAAGRVDAIVISVGNLTLGGTGKTPMVKWIARGLVQRGVRVVLVSRGYRGRAGGNDEARELAQALPGVPHLQDADRIAAARQAVESCGAEVILLDDAFQHRRIARDLDVVLLDATSPFGFGHVFPRGLLREPAAGLRRADVVCLTRSSLVTEERRRAIRLEAQRLAPHADWCETDHAPVSLLDHAGERRPITELAGLRTAAFCGIGNPAAFRATLEAAGCEVAAWRQFPDHHAFSRGELQEVAEEARRVEADRIVCTHKDLVKTEPAWAEPFPMQAVLVEMRLSEGEETLGRRVDELVKRGRSTEQSG